MTDQLQPESEGERWTIHVCENCGLIDKANTRLEHDLSLSHTAGAVLGEACERSLVRRVEVVPASSLQASEQALAQAVMDRDVKRAITRLYLDELDLLAAQYADNEKTEAAIASIAWFLPTTEEARDTRAALTQLQPEENPDEQ